MKRITATPKYLALDVHKATCTYTVRDASGTILERGVVETCAYHLVGLVQRLGPNVHVVFEEGTQAQWLHDMLLPHCAKLVVCDPRAIRAKLANKSDRIDPDVLSERLRLGSLRPVFHAVHSMRGLKELVRAYTALVVARKAADVRLQVAILQAPRSESQTRSSVPKRDTGRTLPFFSRRSFSSSRAGSGSLNRKPCISPHCSSRRNASCSSVSTPSAIT